MPAYIHDNDAELPVPNLLKLCAPADVHAGRDRGPDHGEIKLTYECSNCGAQIKTTVTKQELLN